MILKCINPSGKAVALRCELESALRLAYRLSSFGFSKFEGVAQYSKFHTLGYMSAFSGVRHYLDLLNQSVSNGTFISPTSLGVTLVVKPKYGKVYKMLVSPSKTVQVAAQLRESGCEVAVEGSPLATSWLKSGKSLKTPIAYIGPPRRVQ